MIAEVTGRRLMNDGGQTDDECASLTTVTPPESASVTPSATRAVLLSRAINPLVYGLREPLPFNVIVCGGLEDGR